MVGKWLGADSEHWLFMETSVLRRFGVKLVFWRRVGAGQISCLRLIPTDPGHAEALTVL